LEKPENRVHARAQPLAAELVYGLGAWAEAAAFFRRIPRPLALYSVVVPPLTAGVCEELVWRGYLLTRFERLLRGRVWVAVLLQALLFGLWHGPSPFLPFSLARWRAPSTRGPGGSCLSW
jgi:membrane protease YdiL (CAAX protease family)